MTATGHGTFEWYTGDGVDCFHVDDVTKQGAPPAPAHCTCQSDEGSWEIDCVELVPEPAFAAVALLALVLIARWWR